MMKAPRRSLVRRVDPCYLRAFLLERCLPSTELYSVNTTQTAPIRRADYCQISTCTSLFVNMSATQKIAVHSLAGNSRLHPNISHHTNSSSDLKNTTDDALPNYLHSLKFKQIHTQTDVRLALGYSAVVIAGVLFYFDWKLGWEATKPYTAPAVIAYFLLNGAFSYWLWFVEKGVVYEGEGKTGKVRSSIPPAACRLHTTANRLTLE
jgi:hypothetical protein